LTKEKKQSLLLSLTEEELRDLSFEVATGGPVSPDGRPTPWWVCAREEQLPPEGNWLFWLILAGRGFGKTRAGAEWARRKALSLPRSRGALVAKDPGEARDVMIEGESGILAISPPSFRPNYQPSIKRLTWPNGSQAGIYSSEEYEELRGPQHGWAWCDELPKWRNALATWQQVRFGLRLGQHPQACITTTPRPTAAMKLIMTDPGTVITRGSTYDNLANLSPVYRSIIHEFEGTRLGRQELQGELLDDVPGALWTYGMLDRNRIAEIPDGVQPLRVSVGVDPSASEDGAEAGIVVAMKGSNGHAYVLRDATLRGRPEAWAKRAVDELEFFKGDRIIAEANNGGQMVEAVIKGYRRNTPVRLVHAARGKIPRAEPVSLLYERGLVHHVGTFAELEDQMCQYDIGNPESLRNSPDRMDALVWVLTDLMGRGVVNLGSIASAEAQRDEYVPLKERLETEVGELSSARSEFQW
jgi:phage terminase large subunit-like protein